MIFGSDVGARQRIVRRAGPPSAMSFFGNLRDRAEAVQQRQRVEEEEQRVREFQRFTKDWLKKFLEDCERLADAGDTSAWMDLACPGFPRKSAMNRHAVAKEEAESLRNLGAQVYVGDWHQDHCCFHLLENILILPFWLGRKYIATEHIFIFPLGRKRKWKVAPGALRSPPSGAKHRRGLALPRPAKWAAAPSAWRRSRWWHRCLAATRSASRVAGANNCSARCAEASICLRICFIFPC